MRFSLSFHYSNSALLTHRLFLIHFQVIFFIWHFMCSFLFTSHCGLNFFLKKKKNIFFNSGLYICYDSFEFWSCSLHFCNPNTSWFHLQIFSIYFVMNIFNENIEQSWACNLWGNQLERKSPFGTDNYSLRIAFRADTHCLLFYFLFLYLTDISLIFLWEFNMENIKNLTVLKTEHISSASYPVSSLNPRWQLSTIQWLMHSSWWDGTENQKSKSVS